MKIKSIEQVKKDVAQDNKSYKPEYNLYVEVLVNNVNIKLFEFVCTKRHEMRLDLVCFDIYGNQDYIDVLSNLNVMFNVFDVKENDIILFIEQENIDNVASSQSVINNIKDQLKTANKGKSFKQDNNRQKDVAKRTQTEKNKTYIPPNILDTNNSNMQNANGVITLKPNF